MKPVIVVYGDCQAMAIVEGMKRSPELTDRHDIHRLEPVRAGSEPASASPIAPGVWKRCVLFWQQTGVTTPPPHYLAELPAAARKLTFSALFAPFTFPFSQPDPVMRPTPQPAQYGNGDRFLIQLSESPLASGELYSRWETLQEEQAAQVDRSVEAGARMMVDRDKGVDVPIAGYVMAHFAEQRLLWTFDHPTSALTMVQLERLLRASFPAETKRGGALHGVAQRSLLRHEALDELQIPVSRTVADRLRLRWWTPDHVYQFRNINRYLTLREYVREYVEVRRQRLLAAKGVAA